MTDKTGSMDVVAAVVAFVELRGVRVDDPIVLQATNNVVVWLSPSEIVAKIAINSNRASDELLAVRKLHASGAPVIPPAPMLGDVVHRVDGHDVTFWTYVPQDTASSPSSRAVATALAALHSVMNDPPTRGDLRLPSFDAPILDTMASLDRESFAPELKSPDRVVLRHALNDGQRLLADRSKWQVIHGSPHRFNILIADDTPVFIDFETLAVGPVEWDLAHLEPDVRTHYPGPIDAQLLTSLRILVSAMTSAQCWHSIDRGPDMRAHAEHHLEIVRVAHSEKLARPT